MIMSPTRRFLFSCFLLYVWNRHKRVDCMKNFVGFRRQETLNKTTCPAENIIQNTRCSKGTVCFLLCANQPSCRGLLFEPVEMQCVTCSVEMPMLYNRQEGQYKLIKDLMSWEVSKSNLSTKTIIRKIKKWSLQTGGLYSQQKCESLGGDLLSITSEEENDFIVAHIIQNVDVDIWTSGRGLGGQAETFKWADDTALSDGFTNWGKGQPGPFREDEKCVAIIPEDFTWNDSNCPKECYCICEFR